MNINKGLRGTGVNTMRKTGVCVHVHAHAHTETCPTTCKYAICSLPFVPLESPMSFKSYSCLLTHLSVMQTVAFPTGSPTIPQLQPACSENAV